MKLILITVLALMFSQPALQAQNQVIPSLDARPYIEVTGEGEMQLIPDEIYIGFSLQERYDGHDKIELETLEKKLKGALQKEHFDLKHLSVADADANYVIVRRRKKDVLASQNYVMEVTNTIDLNRVLNILDQVEVRNAHIDRVDHSKMQQYAKEIKIKAIKNAHDKADYLLSALGEQIGNPLIIREQSNFTPLHAATRMTMMSKSVNSDNNSEDQPLSFKKIKLDYKVFVRFAIKQ